MNIAREKQGTLTGHSVKKIQRVVDEGHRDRVSLRVSPGRPGGLSTQIQVNPSQLMMTVNLTMIDNCSHSITKLPPSAPTSS